MADGLRVARPPERPLAVFDGDCGFCRLWIARWKVRTSPKVDYAPSQEVAERFPEISAERFARAFQLVLPDGRVLEGAEAVLAVSGRKPGGGVALALYRHVPGVAPLLELAYRLVARHRSAAMAFTRFAWGRSVLAPTYTVASALFLRLLGLGYLAAFVSLWVQIDGLVGARGILPVAEFLEWVRGQTGAGRFWLLPTLSWISASDAALHLQCAAGVAASLLLFAGLVPAWSALLAWGLYLSLSIAGQLFLEFQWDILLTEAGLLAVFLAPPALRRLRRGGLESPRLARFLLVWLLFRLILSSGAVKLVSHDPAWSSLTALRVHYETQPLPPWTAWFVHQQPPSFQTVSCAFLFFVELLMPLLFFAPRRLRLFSCGMTILLQVLIAATGNYAFFNVLTIALAVLLVDDAVFSRRGPGAEAAPAGPKPWPRSLLVPAAIVLLAASSAPFLASIGLRSAIPGPLIAAYRTIAPLRSANGYGLFAVMTTERREIVVEGSEDGVSWRPYEFRWKPGDPMRRPRFVAPHQPRLDWQMWFAALGSWDDSPWLARLLAGLLERSPAVEALLANDPFAGRPPRYLRTMLYDYRFTDADERQRTGAWWRRSLLGPYGPVLQGRRPGL